MSDIFISYAKEDREWVISFADALRQHGWTVWWDRSIPFGQSFQDVIEKELNEAQCAIVVWSRYSVDSGWVSAEADEARNRNILIPVLIDDASPPLVFRQLQTADLKDWNNKTSSPIFKKMLTDIGVLLGQPIAQSETPPQPAKQEPAAIQKNSQKWFWFAGLTSIFAVAAILFSFSQEPSSTKPPLINKFHANRSHIDVGDTLNLIWKTSNVASVEIKELGIVAHSGSSWIRPEKTSFYTLIAKNSYGETAQKTIEVIVEKQAPEIKADVPPHDPRNLISLFNESFEKQDFKLAEQTLEKLLIMAPNHPEILRITHLFEEEKKARQQAEKMRNRDQVKMIPDQQPVEKEQQVVTEVVIANHEDLKLREQEQQAQREQEAERLRQEKIDKAVALVKTRKQEEAEQLKNEEWLRKQHTQKHAEQQRIKAEIRKKDEEQRLLELEKQEVDEERRRLEDLAKQKALATPASITVKIKGIDKPFKRYGLEAASLKELTIQKLQKAGFNVVSNAEANKQNDSVMMLLEFKYTLRRYGGSELYTYSANTIVFPASSDSRDTLWKQKVESMANTLELRKVNKDFAKNVEGFIRAHPGKGLEFKK